MGWAGGDETETETDICSRDEVCGWKVEGNGAGIRPGKGLKFCFL